MWLTGDGVCLEESLESVADHHGPGVVVVLQVPHH